MVFTEIVQTVKQVFEDHGYGADEVYLTPSNYLATLRLQNGQDLYLKKEDMWCRGSDNCYVLYYDELIVGMGVKLEDCISDFINCFYSQGGFDYV